MTESQFGQQNPGDEGVDLVRAFRYIWTHRKWVAAGTAFFVAIGIAYALLAPPVYKAQAIITLKEREQGGASRLLSQFGGFGGTGGGNSLEKTAIIIKGHQLAETVILDHDLLPRLFPKLSRDPSRAPTVRKGVRRLKSQLKVDADVRKGVLFISARADDSVLSRDLVEYYLTALREKMRQDIVQDADSNRIYLEAQLLQITDPALREKILGMVAMQIEGAMLSNSQPIQILEAPVVPSERLSPQRKKLVAVFLILGLFVSIGGLFAWRSISKFIGPERRAPETDAS